MDREDHGNLLDYLKNISESATAAASSDAQPMAQAGAFGVYGTDAQMLSRPQHGQPGLFVGANAEQRQERMANPRSSMMPYTSRPPQQTSYQPAPHTSYQPQPPATAAAAPNAQPEQLANLLSYMHRQQVQQAPAPPQPVAQPVHHPFPAQMQQNVYGAQQTSYQPPAVHAQQYAQAMARMSEQQRRIPAQQPQPAHTASMPSYPQLQQQQAPSQPFDANQPAAQAMAQRDQQVEATPIADFLRTQTRYSGLSNRIQSLQQAIQSGRAIVGMGKLGQQPADAATIANYRQTLSEDLVKRQQILQQLQAYIAVNGGPEVVRQQADIFQQQQKAALQQQQLGVGANMQQQQQPATAPSMQAPPQRHGSVVSATQTAGIIRAQPPRPTAEQIATLYRQQGLASKLFESAFNDMRQKGSIPPLDGSPIVNGRPIGLYELLKSVLARGGSDHMDATNGWPGVAQAMGVFRPNEDPLQAREAINHLSSLYNRYLRTFELMWVSTLRRRQESTQNSGQMPATTMHEQAPAFQGAALAPMAPQHHQSTSMPELVPAAIAPRGSYGAAQSSAAAGSTLPQQTAFPQLPKALRAPTPADLHSASLQIGQIETAVQAETGRQQLPPLNLNERQKADVRNLCGEMTMLASNFRHLLPHYLYVGGQSHIPTVRRLLSSLSAYGEQTEKLKQGVYLLRPESLQAMRDTWSSCLTQMAAALKDVPRAGPPDSRPGGADRASIISTIKPGLRREDLKPPPAKRARTASAVATDPAVVEGASPGKGAPTPEGASPRPPSASTTPARGRQASARGARGARARGSSISHGRTPSASSAAPSPAAQSTVLPVDPAEQERLADEAAKANPSQYAIDAFLRYQSSQTGNGLSWSGFAEDTGARADRDSSSVGIAPVAVPAPTMPTLSSLAPGFPADTADSSVRSAAAPHQEDSTFDYSAFLNLDEEAGTPELNASNDSPPDDVVATPKSIQATPSKRKQESPQPAVPELGDEWSWDSIFTGVSEPTWQALSF